MSPSEGRKVWKLGKSPVSHLTQPRGWLVLVSIFLWLVVGCKTVPVAPPPPTAAQITAMGQQFLTDPTPSRLLYWASTYYSAFPAAVMPVMNEWFDLQQSLAGERFKAGRLEDAFFHLGNVRQGRGLPPETWKAFLLDYIARQESAGKWATAKYLRQEIEGSPSQDLYEPMDVSDYFKYLVEVRLHYRYWDADAQLPRVSGGLGTGFILDPHHVITAFHVVQSGLYSNVTSYEVQLLLGERLITNGRVAAWENISDLAVIEVPEALEAPKQVWKTFGNSRKLRRGFEVFGLGNPRGLTATLTRGIISSLDRKGYEGEDWLQFDAAQAPGSSGGILVGKDGLIYGVLVAGIRGAALNFCIPSHTVLRYLDKFSKGDSPGHGWLGALVERDLRAPQVIKLAHILPFSPLKALDVRPGARLLQVNQVPVRSLEDAHRQMSVVVPGQVVSLVISNTTPGIGSSNSNGPGETIRTLWVQAGRQPNNPLFWGQEGASKFDTMYLHFGIELKPNPEATSAIINLLLKTRYPNYHMVLRVQPDTYLDHMGVLPGDAMVILQDTFDGEDRILEMVHLPLAKSSNRVKAQPIRNFEALHYKMSRGPGDDDAL